MFDYGLGISIVVTVNMPRSFVCTNFDWDVGQHVNRVSGVLVRFYMALSDTQLPVLALSNVVFGLCRNK